MQCREAPARRAAHHLPRPRWRPVTALMRAPPIGASMSPERPGRLRARRRQCCDDRAAVREARCAPLASAALLVVDVVLLAGGGDAVEEVRAAGAWTVEVALRGQPRQRPGGRCSSDPGVPLVGAAALRFPDLAEARQVPPSAPDERAPPATALLGGALAGSGPGTSPCVDGLSLPAPWWYPGAWLVQTMGKRACRGPWPGGSPRARAAAGSGALLKDLSPRPGVSYRAEAPGARASVCRRTARDCGHGSSATAIPSAAAASRSAPSPAVTTTFGSRTRSAAPGR
jgi:hypothetical protein